MAQSQVYTPQIPYLGAIPGGLSPGKMITIDGYVPHHSQRFAFNIQCGPGVNPRDDIAFHINVRFPEMCVVRNHLQGMQWGPEEIHGGLPITLGNTFQAIILCEQQGFKLALNGSHFCEFPHRLPFQRASHITIDGDVTITLIQYQGGSDSFQPNSQWGGTPSAPPAMGMPTPQAPPAYGPPPPYGDIGYGQNPASLSYAPPPQNPAFSPYPPQGGGYYQPPQMPPYGNTGSAFNPTAPPVVGFPVQGKKKNKAASKALKYGLPIAGIGLGAYAVGRILSRSSSSSSSD